MMVALLSRRAALATLALAATRPQFGRATVPGPRIVASFSILGDLVRVVGGPGIAMDVLVGPDKDPHDFEPGPGDARRLAGADVLVVNGLAFEPWVDKLVGAAGFRGHRIVASAGIDTLRQRGGHAHGHDHGHQHGKAEPDPHIWQDPIRVRRMVTGIAAGLASAHPAGAQAYRDAAEDYGRELDGLDRWIRAELGTVPQSRRKVVTSHDGFAYFAARYGIAFRAPRGAAAGGEPSAADIARIIRDIRKEKVRLVFIETIGSPRVIEQIARESGAQLGGRLYSDSLSAADGPAPTYLAMMRYNVTRLRDAMLME
jgi:zinc/manganese transport system substrate-binding protein